MSSGDPNCSLCVAQRQEQWSRLNDVKSHSEDGCPYCTVMLQGLLHLIPDIEDKFGYDASFRFKGSRGMSVYADPNGSLGYPSPSKPVDLEYKWFTVDEEPEYQPPRTLSCEESIEWARSWIDTCLANHAICGKGNPSPLPTRVLDLGDNNNDGEQTEVRLVESGGQSERYISLSHSWGGEHPLITTMATLQQHKQGIPLTLLPATFRDAVRITRLLGIRYLWIDSLCIIQDSSEDWELEASRMADIYRNGWLTVYATSSKSPSSGILQDNAGIVAQAPQDGDESDPLALLFPAATQLRRNLRLSLSFAVDAHPDFDPFSDPKKQTAFPLLTRAWAYQERLLSPRVLHFGPQEVFWECLQDLDCACGAMKWMAPQHMGSYANRDTTAELPPKISHFAALHIGTAQKNKVGNKKTKQKLLSRWQEMVEEYTQRVLTFPSDRLPAFSGVAADMVEALGMKYCAGQWEETLPVGLLWERSNPADMARLTVNDTRPAPSWSWASADAPVRFLVPLIGPYPDWATPHIYADVLELRCVPLGADTRGRVDVTKSYITLSVELVEAALCVEVDPRHTPDSYELWEYVRDATKNGIKGPIKSQLSKRSFMVRVGKHEPVICVLDISPCSENGDWLWRGEDSVFCAKILESNECFYWLVLRQADRKTSTYERIGVVEDPDANWKSRFGKQTIQIS